MAGKTAAIDIKVSGIVEADKETTDLKKKLKELKKELQGLDEGSEQFQKIAKEAGNITDKLGDVQKTVNTLASDTRKLDAFLSIGEGIAGGFAAAQGAIGLFTDENEELNQALLKVQSAMAVLNGIQAVANTLQKQSAAYIAVSTAAQKAYTLAIGQSTGAMKGLRVALLATGIGAIVAALGLLIANFDKVKEYVLNLFPPLKELGKLFDWIGDLFTTNAEKMQASNKKEAELLEKKIQLQKAKGKETTDLELKLANARVNSYKVGTDEYIQAVQEREVLIATIEKDAEDKREQVRAANEKNRINAIKDADQRAKEQLKAQYSQDLQAAIKNGQETKNITQKYYNDLNEINKTANDKRNKENYDNQINIATRRANLIKDEMSKELALLELTRKQERDANKRNKEALKLIDEQFGVDKLDIIDKYAKLQAEKEKEEDEKRLETNLTAAETNFKTQELQALNQLENGSITLKEFQDQQAQANLDYLQQQRQLLIDEGQSTIDIDKQILETKVAANKEANDKILDQEKANRDARVEIAQSTGSILQSISELAQGKADEMTDFQKGLALAQVAIDTGIALSGALASANSPTPDNLASGGLAGIAKYVALTASILTNVARAKKIIQGASRGSSSVPSSGGGANIPNIQPTNPAFSGQGGVSIPQPGQEGRNPNSMRVYVTETDISTTQNTVNGIKQKARVL